MKNENLDKKQITNMIKDYKTFKNINESINNFDLSKLVTITSINKDSEGNWIYLTNNNVELFLPKEQENKISIINDNFANFVNAGHPITKYFELDGNTIIYAANFAVDAVALKEGRVYLIERKTGGWALPGGFIDSGETPQQAVVRELIEETLAKQEYIKSITPMNMIRANDPREINFFTFPFIIQMKKSAELKYADDAINGKWVLLSRSTNNLVFSHHKEIIKQVNF